MDKTGIWSELSPNSTYYDCAHIVEKIYFYILMIVVAPMREFVNCTVYSPILKFTHTLILY